MWLLFVTTLFLLFQVDSTSAHFYQDGVPVSIHDEAEKASKDAAVALEKAQSTLQAIQDAVKQLNV